jgi:hypothetical protein
MELINESAFASHLYRGFVEDDIVHGTVIVRSTFQIGPGGALSADCAQPIRVQEEVQDDGVTIEDDGAPVKEGIDVCVLGPIEAPRPGTRDFTIRVEVGHVQRTLRVLGDRRWTPRPGIDFPVALERSQRWDPDPDALVATDPEPFDVIPMSWARAFGGTALAPSGAIPFADNPVGRGFLVTLAGADGTLLPNLEDPEHPIRTWQDRPMPVCFAPVPRPSKLRTDRGVSFDGASQRATLAPAFFNLAHPWLVFEELLPETSIRVHGMTAARLVECRVPAIHLAVEVRIASRTAVLPLRTDTVEITPFTRTISLVSRTAFRYRIRPGEERFARVLSMRA